MKFSFGVHRFHQFKIDGSHVSKSSNGVHPALCHNSQHHVVLKDDKVSVREAIPSSTPYPHSSKINSFEAMPLDKREVSSSTTLKIGVSPFYVPEKEDVRTIRDDAGNLLSLFRVPQECFLHGNGSMHVYKSKLHGVAELYKFWDRVLTKQLGSNTYEIACGDKGPFQVMSSYGIGCLMYTYVMESLDVKPPLTPLEMVVLDCLNLCPTNHFSCGSDFPFTWSKVLDLPIIERDSLFQSEIKVADWMSEKSERVKDLKWLANLLFSGLLLLPLASEGGSSKPATSTSISNLTGPLPRL
ncbi:uncharacterized protein G2W53_032959 [Senna tora]|uniref:Uncharacterized protein n=1 Tax=Senna tora TaxID=362788 RepID=A0A834W840_9FABA|nr:uncharacterized protein G2W53_032959 [Senna tora]